MFVDELTITAAAGKGGDGVVRWRQEKFMPMGGPAGGNGGRGGDVYMRAVRDLALLAKYTGAKEFTAKDGESGQKQSRHGEGGADIYIDVPIGATVTEKEQKPKTALEEVLQEAEDAEKRPQDSDGKRGHRGEAGEAITPNTRAQEESEGE